MLKLREESDPRPINMNIGLEIVIIVLKKIQRIPKSTLKESTRIRHDFSRMITLKQKESFSSSSIVKPMHSNQVINMFTPKTFLQPNGHKAQN